MGMVVGVHVHVSASGGCTRWVWVHQAGGWVGWVGKGTEGRGGQAKRQRWQRRDARHRGSIAGGKEIEEDSQQLMSGGGKL